MNAASGGIKTIWTANTSIEISKRIKGFEPDNSGRVSYVISRGDTLWEISKAMKHDHSERYGSMSVMQIVNEIAKENSIKNPDLILTGRILKLNIVVPERELPPYVPETPGKEVLPVEEEAVEKTVPIKEPEDDPNDLSKHPRFISDEVYDASFFVPYIRRAKEWVREKLKKIADEM